MNLAHIDRNYFKSFLQLQILIAFILKRVF